MRHALTVKCETDPESSHHRATGISIGSSRIDAGPPAAQMFTCVATSDARSRDIGALSAMKILVAYDGSISADAAISDLRRAGLPEEGEALVVCVEDGHHVGETHGPVEQAHDHSWKSRLADADLRGEKAAERINICFPRWAVSSEALWGSPAKVLLDVSAWWKPDLLVLGSHGHSRVARLFMGSVSLELVHKAACSVRVRELAHR